MLLVLKLLGWSVHCTVSEAGGIEPIVPMDYTLRQLVNVFMNACMYPIYAYTIDKHNFMQNMFNYVRARC
jgi:hypothetical protein